MAVNVGPYFKTVLILQGLFTAYIVLSLILFMNTPRVRFDCQYRLSEFSRPYIPWEPTAIFSICAILFATFVTYAGASGYKDESAATLRHIKIAIITEGIFGFWAINELSRAIARFEGYVNGLGWQESGCPALEKNVFFLHSALFCLFFFKVPFLLLLDSYLKSLGDDFIFFDYIMTIVSWIRNCVKYGRQRISFTSSFVRSQVQTRFGKAIRVSQKNDTLFREVEIGSRMFGAITLELLKENIAHKYDRHPNEIIRLTKNGNVLIVDDADVNRIGNEDHIEVEFEDVGTRLREVNSVMLEDSISETTVPEKKYSMHDAHGAHGVTMERLLLRYYRTENNDSIEKFHDLASSVEDERWWAQNRSNVEWIK